ncbi:hypothetical protein [Kineococcus sp. SYSU DK003]|uniref:hypothetical protein n=1 Tax=Kineococcus sp. SYSU DK003 TaxID=3383124 RepID=UPI003D7EFB4F
MHLLLEGSDLQELLTQAREQHGPAARVVRAERIRSGGVAGFFSKERYEVTVELDGESGTEEPTAAPTPAPASAGDPAEPGEEREALDFEALLAAADAAESSAATTPAAVPAAAPLEQAQGEDFESARAGLLEVLRASGTPSGEQPDEEALKVSDVDAEDHLVIAQTGDTHTGEFEPAADQQVADGAEDFAAAYEQELAEQARLEAERADAQRADAERAEAERVAAERAAAERADAERAEAERVAAERAEAERAEAERVAAERAEAERVLEEERMQQLQIERQEQARREAARAQELRREEARADVRRRQAERLRAPQAPASQTAPPARSLGEVLAAADAAEGTNRLEAMLGARAPQAPQRSQNSLHSAPQARPHRPISTESDSFARTVEAVRSSASTTVRGASRTPAPGVTADVRSVTTPQAQPARPRPGRDQAQRWAADRPSGRPQGSGRTVRTSEDRVSEQFGTANGTANGAAGTRRPEQGPARRPELRRPAAVEDQFGDQFGDRFESARRGDWAHDYQALEQPFEQAYEQPFEQPYEQSFERGYEGAYEGGFTQDHPVEEERAPRQDERAGRTFQATRAGNERMNRDGDDNEAMSMDLTYREPVTTYSERSVPSRVSYREPQDTGDVLRLARDIDVPAPLRVGAGELVVVIGEADAVVSAALLVADEVGSEAPLVLGRADVQNTVTADELPARQEQARRWSAPLTVAIPARPTGADAERAARMAAEVGAASVVVCVDATRRSHAVASLLRALEGVGLPARRLAVHRAAESPDPLDVLSLDVPVGFLDGRPATSGAWAGLLLDAAGDHGVR